ncbi:sodium- and chloride-dependent GABA transporter 1-like isoform X2 [Haliotis rubra]|uniref:sodium- and chloride-dependent GABA transporter 1-like isoform X2 n=1 Tax=Haliotis rubra TaxID=36100 RepID=UPI001EE4EF82|nr:sodium- and chloride-dependent GABA transporter 1-like isoform X2 [Haliotis rubra]
MASRASSRHPVPRQTALQTALQTADSGNNRMHEQWRHQLDYIVTMLGYGIGSGTFIKFPFYCTRNGGGAFLIPFLLFTIIGAMPCVYLEMVIGQYSQSGPINVWNLCPPFKGIGLGGVIYSWVYCTYFSVIFCWFMFYLYHSFSDNFPWNNCDNHWNTIACTSYNLENTTWNNSTSYPTVNETVGNVSSGSDGINDHLSAAEEFWRFQVLQVSDGLETLGGIRWPLAGCLVVTMGLLFLWLSQEIKVAGKLVYVTVAIPYILTFIFLIRGCLLPGSADGIYYYINPNFERLKDPRVWIEALSLSLYSLGVSTGCIVTLAGHNVISNRCLKDAIVTCLVDALTCVFVGFACFSIIGHIAHLRGLSVEHFQSSGFNLAFIVYPDFLSSLPLPQLWLVLTFVTLMSLAIDTLVPQIDIIVAALGDQFPLLRRRRRFTLCAVLSTVLLFGLVYVSQGGIYVLTLVDWFSYFPALALYALLECVVVGWCYGTKRLEEDVSMLWGEKIPGFMHVCIRIVCPVLILVIIAYSGYSYRSPKYGNYIFPAWANVVGWMISLVAVLPFPIVFTWTVVTKRGTSVKEKIQKALEPTEQWKSAHCEDSIHEMQPMA